MVLDIYSQINDFLCFVGFESRGNDNDWCPLLESPLLILKWYRY